MCRRACPGSCFISGVCLLAILLGPRFGTAQELGHKVLGGVGINGGVQPEPGIYLADRFLFYSASTITNRDGEALPVVGLDIDARSNVLGVSVTLKPKGAPYFTVAAGVPLASISLNSTQPLTALDRSGLGDAFVQPLKVGWRFSRYDIGAGYTFYAPTGRFEPRRGGTGRGYWTHQVSAGGAVFSKDRQWRASALASYDINTWKRGIHIKRGNTLQVQGGAGVVLSGIVLLGVAGFALWQVTDDLGADVPAELRGLRTRDYALGPELGIAIVPMRLNGEVRLEREFGTRARPQGYVLVAGLSYRAWLASAPDPRASR